MVKSQSSSLCAASSDSSPTLQSSPVDGNVLVRQYVAMRRGLSLHCSVAVLLAFVLEPSTHLHVRDISASDDHRAQASVIHSHAGSHGHTGSHAKPASDRHGTEFSAGDDHGSTKQLSLFQPNLQPPPILPALVVEPAVYNLASLTGGLAFVPAERAHSPPLGFSISPRSPPV